jgi:hypothetical protein
MKLISSFSKMLSEIDQVTVQAVELSVGSLMLEKYGGTVQYGPVSAETAAIEQPVVEPEVVLG